MALAVAELTWPEIEDELDDGNTLIVVPTASIEQHGPGLPLSVDAIRADELGERIADELGCFVAPPVRPGVSEHHMAFPGTISLRPETFEAVVADYCRSLDRHGFEDVALLTTHGGNADALDAVAEEMDAALDANAFVAGDRDEFMTVRFGAMERHDVSSEEAGKHAGAAETSFLLESNPDLVRDDERAEGYLGDAATDRIIDEGLSAYTENGVPGDQRRASRAAGRTLIEDCVGFYAEAIADETR